MRSEKRSAIVVVDGQKKKIVYDKVVNYQEAEDGGVLRKSYGIRYEVDDASASLPQEEDSFGLIEDVSTSETFVDKIISRLIRSHACPIHVRDIIEDSLP